MNRFERDFADPPRDRRPAPQWSWNGDLTRARIEEQLDQFAAQGCGGLFAHARPGHVTGYLTDRWFALWSHARREAARRGMRFDLYDEFMCPGGDAGGHVVAGDPGLALRQLSLVALAGDARRSGMEILCRLAADPGGRLREAADPREATHAIALSTCAVNASGFPPADVLRREAAEAFLRTTHERYRRLDGRAFGGSVRFMFCDEPHLAAPPDALPFSRHFAREFRRDHGYAIEDRLLSLCFPRDDSPEVRFDFWRTANRLFNENFMRPLHDWCARRGLLFTGHLMENEWPSPQSNPDNMAALRWMHAPGEDLLGFQFRPTRLRDNGLYLLNLKELSSVVNQLGRRWSMVETCGGGGFQTAFAYFKPCEDFTLAFGVNLIDPHLAHQSIAGLRKHDWPQTLSDHSPWWRWYRAHADHVARVNVALSSGREHNRALLLMPTTTAWMHATGGAFDRAAGGAARAALDRLRETQIELATALHERQADFDLGDEFLIEEFGRASGRRLAVGRRAYDVVIVPPAMETWNASTLRRLGAFLARGGTVLALGPPPGRIDARRSDAARPLALSKGWTICADVADLLARLRALVPPHLAAPDGAPLPGGLMWRRSVRPGGDAVWFFCNPWEQPLEARVAVEGACADRCDTAAGRIAPAAAGRAGDRVILPLSLPPRGHALFVVRARAPARRPPPDAAPALRPVPLRAGPVERTEPNVLVVDYCDVAAYGRSLASVNAALADRENWRWQGFDGNPWTKQFRRTLIDRRFPAGSGFSVRYTFVLKGLTAAARGALRVAVERPWRYRMRLNGRPLPSDSGARWLDEDVRALPAGRLMRNGRNTLELVARPFHPLCEIAPVYVLGDFRAEPAERGFALAPARRLRAGDWTRQGLPFYHHTARYRFGFRLAAPAQGLLVRIPSWAGSVAVARLDGREIAPVLHPPFECPVPGPVGAGAHELAIDVVGDMKNLMGSHHIEALPLAWTYEYAPSPQPPGAAYRLRPSGLLAAPELFAVDG